MSKISIGKAADAFRTISEVADDLEVPKHVLRFWENRFPQIKPMKRGGGRRYYRPADLDLLRGIRHLLHNEGFTIKGVQKILREQGVETVKMAWQRSHSGSVAAATVAPVPPAAGSRSEARETRRGKAVKTLPPVDARAVLDKVIAELMSCRNLLLGQAEQVSEAAAPPKARTRARR